jgi:hypothetical protein
MAIQASHIGVVGYGNEVVVQGAGALIRQDRQGELPVNLDDSPPGEPINDDPKP